jgi:hypothetical protein
MNEMALVIEKVIKERDMYLKRGLELASYPHYSGSLDEMYPAFAEAQGEFPSIVKEKKGYGYKYAELSSVLNLVIPVLSKHGLNLTQYMTRDCILHTRIGHASGQFFESQYKIPVPTEAEFSSSNKKTSYMQELGSRRTYVRRYEILAILGINPEGEDSDAGKLQ